MSQRRPSVRQGDPREFLAEAGQLAKRLRAIYGTAVAVEMALRQQNADQDQELAECLRYGVCGAICDARELLDSMTEGHGGEEEPAA